MEAQKKLINLRIKEKIQSLQSDLKVMVTRIKTNRNVTVIRNQDLYKVLTRKYEDI